MTANISGEVTNPKKCKVDVTPLIHHGELVERLISSVLMVPGYMWTNRTCGCRKDSSCCMKRVKMADSYCSQTYLGKAIDYGTRVRPSFHKPYIPSRCFIRIFQVDIIRLRYVSACKPRYADMEDRRCGTKDAG